MTSIRAEMFGAPRPNASLSLKTITASELIFEKAGGHGSFI